MLDLIPIHLIFFKVLISWHGQHKLLQLFKSHLVLLVSLYKSKIIRCCTVNIVTLSLPILEKLFFWGFTHFSTSTYYGTTSAVWETTARQLAKFKCKFLVASKIHLTVAILCEVGIVYLIFLLTEMKCYGGMFSYRVHLRLFHMFISQSVKLISDNELKCI
jgi:hypothetical protein